MLSISNVFIGEGWGRQVLYKGRIRISSLRGNHTIFCLQYPIILFEATRIRYIAKNTHEQEASPLPASAPLRNAMAKAQINTDLLCDVCCVLAKCTEKKANITKIHNDKISSQNSESKRKQSSRTSSTPIDKEPGLLLLLLLSEKQWLLTYELNQTAPFCVTCGCFGPNDANWHKI